MKVAINVLGEARGLFGSARIVVAGTGEGPDGVSVATVLSHACDSSAKPGEARSLLFHGNTTLNPAVLVMINDVDHRLLGGLDAVMRDGDEITVLPVLHGG